MPVSYMSALLVLLKIFGIFPNENIKMHSILATLHLVALHIPLLFIIIPAILDCYEHRSTQDVVSLTNFIYTVAVYIMLDSIYLYLCVRKFQLRYHAFANCELWSKNVNTNNWNMLHRICFCSSEIWICLFLIAGRRRGISFVETYDKAEKYSDFVVKNFFASCFIGTCGAIILPFAKPLVHHFRGSYSFESWYTPYPAQWVNIRDQFTWPKSKPSYVDNSIHHPDGVTNVLY